MDAFYASVEMMDNPDLKGKPVIVGGSSCRGVVSAASYEARKFGIHSALPIMTARNLCPQGIFLPIRMTRYREISQKIMALFLRYTPLVEPISLDEAFLDVTASAKLFGSAEKIAHEIKQEVTRQTGLTISAGIASSKLISKIASDIEKPDGFTSVATGEERAFLAPLAIKRLWGVGKKTQETLALFGVKSIGDLAQVPLNILISKFGKLPGQHLYLVSRGIDEREVSPEREVKSVGHEDTYEKDIVDLAAIKKELLCLCNRVGKRVRKNGLSGKTVTLKVKYRDFQQITRSQTLQSGTNDDAVLFETICSLLPRTNAGRRPVRLLGVTLSNFTEPHTSQLLLFDNAVKKEKRRDLFAALDNIGDKFGNSAILPAKLLEGRKESEDHKGCGRRK
jgi:DNA polymerase-4